MFVTIRKELGLLIEIGCRKFRKVLPMIDCSIGPLVREVAGWQKWVSVDCVIQLLFQGVAVSTNHLWVIEAQNPVMHRMRKFMQKPSRPPRFQVLRAFSSEGTLSTNLDTFKLI